MCKKPEEQELSELDSESISIQVQSQKFERHLKDFSDQIDTWLHNTLALAESFDINAIASELEELDARWKMPGFQLAVVGEFGRGKSRLINRLLDRSLLPERPVPTTRTITSIRADLVERMEVHFLDEHREIRSLEETSWHDLLVDNQTDEVEETIGEVQLFLKHDWLQEIDMQIIDTPGLGEFGSPHAKLVSEVLRQCDAALMLISAPLSLSLTEIAFLQHEILGRYIPHIIVVVSQLDLLSQNQKLMVFKRVREGVARICSHISVIPAHPLAPNISEAEALEEIRHQIKSLINRDDRLAWRSQQVARTIVRHLYQLIEAARIAKESASLSTAKREEVLRKAHHEALLDVLQWERIGLELEQRCLDLNQELRRRFREGIDSIARRIFLELSKLTDLKSWWKKDFPLLLHQELLVLAQSSESFLANSLAKDARWLQDELERTLHTSINQLMIGIDTHIDIVPNLREIPLDNIERHRLFLKIGSGAAAIAGYFLFNPVGSAISVITEIFGELVFNKKLEEQRRQLGQEVGRSIELSIEEYADRISASLSELYRQVTQDMKREQAIWQSAKNAVIEKSGNISEERSWQRLIEGAMALKQDIVVSIEQSNETSELNEEE